LHADKKRGNMRKIAVYIILLFALVVPVLAQGAKWYPVDLKYNWNADGFGFCPYDSQCLVSANGDTGYDNQPEQYYEGNIPKCINNTQHILDYYCENGKWSSRTKMVATELLSIANQSTATTYSVFCDRYNEALNRYFYLVNNVNVQNRFTGSPSGCFPFNKTLSSDCANDVCVLSYGGNAAFGLSLNVPPDHPKSFLSAVNLSRTDCNNVNAGQGFKECTNSPAGGRLYYDKDLNSLIYIPTGSIPTSQSASFSQILKNNLREINDYVFKIVHKPGSAVRNFTFFNQTGILNKLYYAQKGSKSIFAFLEEDKTFFRHDYIGANYNGMDFGTNPCFNLFKLVGTEYKGFNSYCENQTATGRFFVVAKRTPGPGGQSPLVDAWKNLGGKLRP